MDYNFLAIIFVFGLLVLIHELGHFIAAKLMGVRVERFSIGFPPRLIGKKIGDTDYCISAIPLGGYVKMAGMIDESMDTKSTGADYEFNSKPVWQRMIIIIAGVVMNLILAIIILSSINYIKGERFHPYTEVRGFSEGMIAQKIGFEPGDKILEVNSAKVTSWEEINNLFIQNLNNDLRFLVKRDGQEKELSYKKEWFREKGAETFNIIPQTPSWVGNVVPASPAASAGFEKGDKIYAINQKPVKNWQEMTKIISAHPGDSIEVKWKRNGDDFSTIVVPGSYDEADSLGNMTKVGRIGIYPYYEERETTLLRAIGNGFFDTFGLIKMNIQGLWWVISGTKSASDVIGGPIMIAKMAGDAAAAGWENLWILIAALSAILAFFNILPIPALDGGHLVFLIIEFFIGKPLSIKTRLVVQQVGMAILLTLIVLIIYIDLKRLL